MIFFFVLHFDNTFVVSVVFQIRFKFYLFPLFKSLDCFISYFSPLEPERRQNGGAKTENSLRVAYDFRNKCFPVEHLSLFNRRGGVYSMTLWCQRVEVVLVEERQVNMSPNKAWVHFPAALPLATGRSIYKSNRLFASQSPVIYDLAPLTRPASFHFC